MNDSYCDIEAQNGVVVSPQRNTTGLYSSHLAVLTHIPKSLCAINVSIVYHMLKSYKSISKYRSLFQSAMYHIVQEL